MGSVVWKVNGMCGVEGDCSGDGVASGTCRPRYTRQARSLSKDPAEIPLDCIRDSLFLPVYTHDSTVTEERHISPVSSGDRTFF